MKNLKNNLEGKAKKEKRVDLGNIFLLNNFQYILSNVRKNNLLEMKDMSEWVVQFEKAITNQIAM